MELRQLRYFVGVCEAGSLLQAASRLHVAQPALGQQIAALEDEVGGKLFERSSRGMALTEAGRTFLEHARVVLADVERARLSVRDASAVPRGDVAIGLPTTISLLVSVPLLRACRERLPQVRLKVVEAYSGFLSEWLRGGRLDLAILFGDATEPALAKRALLEERLALVTHANGPRTAARISLARLAAHPMILPGREHGLRRIIDQACMAASVELDVIAEIDSLPSVKKAVEAGIGSTILSLSSVAEEVAAGKLRASVISDEGMTRRVVCATNVARPSTPASTAVIAMALELIREMVDSGTWPSRWIDNGGGR
ncbi:LysR substrate-binding domain-containing protein [Variovorax sp. J22R133]|uniref:LysR family transcriptional regulator n=1 Tax=Variovorax brevis TaxID=3053503 RepID=UPI0025781F21|nr:LysR substrate-binding domain-containing protein [Variovorax sp. J22R133]MDM0115824.1 LysR substrate-binding domain-containing protein [Variovorax sp. J22R133]